MKYRNYILNILLVLMLFGAYGCEAFLTTNPSTQLNEEMALPDVQALDKVMEGNYDFWGRGGSGPWVGGNGIIGVSLINEMGGRDWLCRGSFSPSYTMSPTYNLSTSTTSGELWTYLYAVVDRCNLILERVDELPGPDDIRERVKGEALAMRAEAYFYLARFFQHTYVGNEDKPGVVIRLKRGTYPAPRTSLRDVYENLIIPDFEEAAKLLQGKTRPSNYRIDYQVVKGLQARLYLTIERWDDAQKAAAEAVKGYSIMSPEAWQTGFTLNKALFEDVGEEEWIWRVETADNYQMSVWMVFTISRSLANNRAPAKQICGEDITASKQCLALYEPGDIRATYADDNAAGVMWFKNTKMDSYNPLSEERHIACNKLREYTEGMDKDPDFRPSFCLMRASEMMLIQAEAFAVQGKYTEAKDALDAVRTKRGLAPSTLTGEELLKDIRLERRRELHGEGLCGLFDIKRLKENLGRTHDHEYYCTDGPSQTYGEGSDIPAGSNRFVYQLPLNEFLYNTDLDESKDQNPI